MSVLTPITVEPLAATLGATVRGLSVAQLDDHSWATIEAAFHRYALLIFPAQFLTDDQQTAFAARFGELEPGAALAPISNVSPEGELRAPDSLLMQQLRGNEGWHSDSSFMPRSAKASMLSAHVVPRDGGETEWADMTAAYEALDAATRAEVDRLSALHCIRYSQMRVGFTSMLHGTYGVNVAEPPLRPLVKVHPVTGRPSLFIGRHAHAIPGLNPQESEQYLDRLLADACRPPRTHRHKWTPGDIAVWDNRCVLHRALPYDYSDPRIMKHSRIAGEESEVAAHFGGPTSADA